MSSDPVELCFPNACALLPQDDEERKILWQCVREVDVARATAQCRRTRLAGGSGTRIERDAGIGDPERENRMNAVRLRFEWIGIERGAVIGDVQFVHPVKIMVHEARAKSG